MKDLNLTAFIRFFKGIIDTIQRYHITIITVLVLGTLIAVVANVNTILSQPPDEAYRQEAQQKALRSNFDKQTIDAINQLRKRQESSNTILPPGRINPFAD